MRLLRTWFDGTARAIVDDPALRLYAVLLSFVHALTGVAWFTYKHISALASRARTASAGRSSPTATACARSSPRRSCARRSWRTSRSGPSRRRSSPAPRARRRSATFVAATVAGTLLYSLDYRLRLNQTYMFGWVVSRSSSRPRRKAQVLQALVALFYFWAGTLKLNAEWVTGAALYAKPFLVPAALVPAACVYVLVLEMVFVWGLFSSSPRWRWAVYAQLLLFHAVSWKVVGYFYPLLMFGLTAIFPLVWLFAPDAGADARAPAGGTSARSAVGGDRRALLGVPARPVSLSGRHGGHRRGEALRAPHVRRPDPSARGARSSPDLPAGARARDAHQRPNRLRYALRPDRARSPRRSDSAGSSRSATARARLASTWRSTPSARPTTAMQPLIHVDDFCRKPIAYSVWRHNDWIGK